MHSSPLALPLAFFLAACAGAETPNENVTSSPALNEATNAQALCVQSFQRQRECTDAFIPALVDARVRHDRPAGIAAADHSEGRAALVAKALEEWRTDSLDASIHETCAGMISHGAGTPEMSAALSACLERTSCGEFVPCQIQLIEHTFG